MRTLGAYVGTFPTNNQQKHGRAACSATSRASVSDRSSICSLGTLDENHDQDSSYVTDTLSYLLNRDVPKRTYEVNGVLRDVIARVYVDQQHQQPIIALSAKCHGHEVEGSHPVAWKNRTTEHMQLLLKDCLYEIQQWYVHNESDVSFNLNNTSPYWRNLDSEYEEVLPSNYLVSARVTYIDWNGDIGRFLSDRYDYDADEVYNNTSTSDCTLTKVSKHDSSQALFDGMYDGSRHGDVSLEAMCSVECHRMPAPWNDEPFTNLKPKLESIPTQLNSCTFYSDKDASYAQCADTMSCMDVAFFSKILVRCRLVS